MRSVELSAVSVIAELTELGWKYTPTGSDEILTLCPGHEHPLDGKEHSPSCFVNIVQRTFRCRSPQCGVTGDFLKFYSLAVKQPPGIVSEIFIKKYGIEEGEKTVEVDVIEKWHASLWKHEPFLKELYARGLTDEIIRDRRYGFDGERITIPIRNKTDLVVNVLFYLPGAPTKDKFKNQKGRGKKPRLYRIDQLSYDRIIICAGPTKADVTAARMNPSGFGAISALQGENSWSAEFSKELVGKQVFIAYDIDDAGIAGANKLAALIVAFASSVHLVKIPLDRDKYPKGDISDYWGKEGGTSEAFEKLLDTTERWSAPTRIIEEEDTTPPIPVELENATDSENVGKTIAVKGTITAMDMQPFLVPSKIGCSCDKSANFCAICPVFPKVPNPTDRLVDLTISALSPAVLGMVETNSKTQREAIRTALGIPPCRVVDFTSKEFHNVFLVHLTPQLDISKRTNVEIYQPLYYVGGGISLNSSYEFIARVLPHPKDQKAVLLSKSSEPSIDSLDTYSPTVSDLASLRIFSPKSNSLEDIAAKLTDIYLDLEANVTFIYKRPEIHLTNDLTYFSVLSFNFDGRPVTKGWVETIIVGDSAQGKSEVSNRLLTHYGQGEKIDCKNATIPGVIGGVLMGNGKERAMVKWGVIPRYDRRLVVLEEVKGLARELIGKMTDMRSSGIAEIGKIQRSKTNARTRLLGNSNSRSGRAVSSYAFGIECLTELIGSLEDVRRFDMALLVSNKQVNLAETLELKGNRPVRDHIYTSELCRSLVLWAWTRTPEDISFTSEAVQVLLDENIRMTNKYTENIPLVDKGSFRFKLARLSCALAARLFSTDDTGTKLIIHASHVKYVSKFLDDQYSSPIYGYADLSAAMSLADKLVDPELILNEIKRIDHPVDFITLLLSQNDIEMRDLCDWGGFDQERGRSILSLFVRKRALVRDKYAYHKTPSFIEFLKSVKESGQLDKYTRPDFLSPPKERSL